MKKYKYSRKEIAQFLRELHFDKRAYDITCKLLSTLPSDKEEKKECNYSAPLDKNYKNTLSPSLPEFERIELPKMIYQLSQCDGDVDFKLLPAFKGWMRQITDTLNKLIIK